MHWAASAITWAAWPAYFCSIDTTFIPIDVASGGAPYALDADHAQGIEVVPQGGGSQHRHHVFAVGRPVATLRWQVRMGLFR